MLCTTDLQKRKIFSHPCQIAPPTLKLLYPSALTGSDFDRINSRTKYQTQRKENTIREDKDAIELRGCRFRCSPRCFIRTGTHFCWDNVVGYT